MSAREVAERLRKRRVTNEVQTPEGTLYVRGLTGRERSEYFSWIEGASVEGLSKQVLSDQRLLCIALCDEDGAALFDSEEAGMEVVGEWNHEDVTKAAKEVLRLSGLGKEGADAAEKKS